MDATELLERLSTAYGPPGHEDEVRDAIREVVEPLADEVRTDALGNLIVTKRGRRGDVLLLDAHMDEVAFMTSYVEESGFLRLAPLGGWDARVLPSHAVTVLASDGGRVRGVIGTMPPHVLSDEERKRPPKIEELFVDVGASSRDEVEEMGIAVGSPLVPSYPFERLGDDLVMGKAFDDRAGCTVAIEALRAVADDDLDLTVVCAFVTGEELGLRGARTAAFQVAPKVALALEGTTAVDVPGVSGARRASSFREGPAITLADRTLVADRDVVRLLEELASKEDIAVQHKLPTFGGTDAGAIHITGAGAKCGVLSVPCRYIHTPLSLLRPSDLDAAGRLTAAFVREAGSLLE